MIPLGIAAGYLKRAEQLEPLLRISPEILKFITFGSYTREPRGGNPGNVFWENGEQSPTALNSLGMPNPGIRVAQDFMLGLGDTLVKNGRIGRVSVAGSTPEDYAVLAQHLRFLSGRFYHLELNLGCPNVRDGGELHRIASFQPEVVNETIRRVWKVYDTVGLQIGIKLSPYSDPYLLKEVAAVIASHDPHVSHVVSCNTFPNARGYDSSGKSLIGSDGRAGLSGTPMKHIALGQVEQLRDALPKGTHIVGVGGISSAKDVRDMELAGADSVHVGTAFFRTGDPRVLQQIAEEYAGQYGT